MEKGYKFSSEKKCREKYKSWNKLGRVAFSGILNAIDNYEEFGTTKSNFF